MRAQIAEAIDAVATGSSKAEHWLDRKTERWGKEHVHFVSHAQRAVRQALYFMRLIEKDADETLREHVRGSVADLLQGVPSMPVPPPEPEPALRADAQAPNSAASEVEKPGKTKRPPPPYTGAREKFKDLKARWERLVAASGIACDVRALESLEKDLKAFLHASEAASLFIRLTYTRLPAIARAVRQHLGFAVGLVLAFAVLFGVEAVSSLFQNRPLYGWIAVVFAALPGIVLVGLESWLRKSRAPRWDVGGRVAREVFPTHIDPDPWIPWHPPKQHLTRRIYVGLLYKIGLYVLIWAACWGFVWLLVNRFQVDPPLLTIYLIAVMLAAVAFAGAAIDFVDAHSQAPVRGILLSGVIVVGIAVLGTDDTNWLIVWPALWAILALPWVWRVRQARVMTAVIVIIAGIVAAQVTASSRIEAGQWKDDSTSAPAAAIDLADWPAGGDSGAPIVVMAASGGGSRAAIMAARTLQRLRDEHPRIAENLQAISSVSGGSLASAAYVVRQLRASGSDTGGLPSCDASLVQAMGQDFLYPTLRSVLPFQGGRAEGIQRAWQECPSGLGEMRLSRLADLWRSHNVRAAGTAPPFPVPIFNSVSLDRHAVAITPLTGEFFRQGLDSFARAPADAARGARDDSWGTWVFYRSGIYHVSDFGQRVDPKLTEAVRASANFPFGFPLVEVATKKPLWYSPRVRERLPDTLKLVHLTDGGALSNSGMWPLLPLLLNKEEAIRRRGVLLIIVDAGRMPKVGATDRQIGLLQTIFDKAPKSERLHFQMLEQLARVYGHCFAFVQISIDPLKRNNIYTTWALDEHARALLDTVFADSWRSVSPQLAPAFASLRGCKPEPRFTRVKRVPVD